ncbi:MAG: hypothetical protein AAGA23_13715 [Pseudomonadota bacterium]
MNDNDLIQRLRRLPRERELSQDAWPQIAARLEAKVTPAPAAAPPAQGPWAALATAACIVLLASVGFRLETQGGPVPDAAISAAPASHLPLLSASTEREFSGALQDLLPITVDLGKPIPGTPLAVYEQSLSVVQGAEKAVRQALEQDPESRYLNNMLTDLKRRQIDVLRSIARVSGEPSTGSTS